MSSSDDFDMDRICDRIRYELKKWKISHMKVAGDLGVNRDLIFDYTNENLLQAEHQSLERKIIAFWGIHEDSPLLCIGVFFDIGNSLCKNNKVFNLRKKVNLNA